MEYKIDGIVKLSATNKLRLYKRLNFTSPFGASVNLDSTQDNAITVEILLEAKSEDAARENAEIELSRIGYLLSYFHSIKISSSSITGIVPVCRNREGKIVLAGKGILTIDAKVFHVHELNAQSVDKLAHRLEKEYPTYLEEIFFMWKEAISIEEPALKYLLLYRLMEYLFRGDTEKLKEWIVSNESSVLIHSENRPKRDVTHYTYLRDNIHRKKKEFPFEDIKNALPKLQDLVKQAIEEKISSIDEGS